MGKEDVLRKELLAVLRHGNAHMTFEETVEDFPLDRINDKAPNMPYSPWHIIEHMRMSQRDIIEFIQDLDYVWPAWPEDYFPSPAEKTDQSGWQKSIRDFLADRAILENMAEDRATDLFAPLAHAKEYNIFRQILLAADHNAYHTGELALMCQVMEAWPPDKVLYDAT